MTLKLCSLPLATLPMKNWLQNLHHTAALHGIQQLLTLMSFMSTVQNSSNHVAVDRGINYMPVYMGGKLLCDL